MTSLLVFRIITESEGDGDGDESWVDVPSKSIMKSGPVNDVMHRENADENDHVDVIIVLQSER